MAGFDGNGVFTRNYSWATDALNGVKISSSRMDTEWTTLVGGFNNCLTRDGQGRPSAAINWNGQNLTNIALLGATGAVTFGSTLAVTGTSAFTGAITATGGVIGNVTGNASGLSSTLAIGSGGTGQTTATNAINALLPSQTSQSGKVLGTNGTVASWVAVSGTGDMLRSNNLSDVLSVSTARSNLGIGSMALRAVTISTSAPTGGSDGDIWFRY